MTILDDQEQRKRWREASARWRRRNPRYRWNPERSKEIIREWKRNNPEKMATYSREHYLKNRDRLLEQRRRARLERQAIVTAIKLASGCVDCGYKEHAQALDFDHRSGVEKLGHVARMVNGSKKRLLAEIAKCEVVCANCHRIRTAGRREQDEAVA